MKHSFELEMLGLEFLNSYLGRELTNAEAEQVSGGSELGEATTKGLSEELKALWPEGGSGQDGKMRSLLSNFMAEMGVTMSPSPAIPERLRNLSKPPQPPELR